MDSNSEFKFGGPRSFSLTYINLYWDSIYAYLSLTVEMGLWFYVLKFKKMILKIKTNWKSFWCFSSSWKFNIKVKNPPTLWTILPYSPTSPFLEKTFHPDPYYQIWGSQPRSHFIKGWWGGSSNYAPLLHQYPLLI